jgi:glutamate synthase domain-containing protein 3
MFACGTLCIALAMHGGGYYLALAFLNVLFFIGLKNITTSLQKIFVRALVARESESALANLFDTALNNMPHGLCMFGPDGRLAIVNRRFSEMMGLDLDIDLGSQPIQVADIIGACVKAGSLEAGSGPKVIAAIKALRVDELTTQDSRETDPRALLWTTQPMSDGGMVVLVEDITERRSAAERITHMASYDDLTALPNRVSFRNEIERLLAVPQVPADVPRLHTEVQEHGLEKSLDNILIAKSRPAIDKGERVQFIEVARNVNRSVGAMLSGAVTQVHPEGLPDDTIRIQLEGTGGQSFGAFLTRGITLYLIGDANDYTGKGLSGGRVIVRPSIDFRGDAAKNIIVGNTVMYGATTGEAFFSGVAGERFAVRLSGATAVVEGTGDHGCEYMTGGTVAVLGKTGRNFAAGMSGGVAYVYDEDGQFAKRCNTAMVSLEKVLSATEQQATVDKAIWHRDQTDEAQLKKLLEDHNRWTGSKRARELLDNWAEARAKFVKVFPNEYKRALGEINARKSAVAVTAKAQDTAKQSALAK